MQVIVTHVKKFVKELSLFNNSPKTIRRYELTD